MSMHFARQTLAVAVAASIQIGAVQVSAESFALEEIVVTAQKREQSLQDVPSTVNAIKGDDLADMKLFNFSDLEQVTPGLDLRTIDGRAGSIALRGVDFNPNSGAAAAVDVYWNDVTLGSNASGGVFQELFDLGRVELLRGPQGTLQGRTSPAGAVAIHTAKPDMDEVEGYVRTTFTDNDGNNTQFGASLPIIPGELSVRVAGVFNDSELSEVRNLLDGDITGTRTEGGRISVAWLPTDELSAELAYQFVDNELSNYATLVGSSTLSQGLPDLEAGDRTGISLQPDLYSGRFENTSLKITWDVADHQLTFVSGYSEVSSARDFDNAVGNSQAGYTLVDPLTPTLGLLDSQMNDPQVMRDQNYASSQELRLASMDNDFWDYSVGLYYGNESGFFNRQIMRSLRAGPNSSLYYDAEAQTSSNAQSYGVFAHNTFYLNDQWTAQAGLRWQRQERTVETSLILLEDLVLPPSTTPLLTAGSTLAELVSEELQTNNSEAWTGSASLQYAFSDYDATAYISAGTSFRPGGVTVAAADLRDLTEYNEEDSWSIEVGAKSTWLDNRLRLNGALFYQNYSDYIGRVSNVTIYTGRTSSITTNGDARIQGAEVDFEYLVSQNLRVRGGISYVEAEYLEGASIPCNDTAVPAGETAASCDVSGVELGTQPSFSGSFSSDYTLPLGDFDGYLSGLYKFSGRRTDVDSATGDLGGYGTFDMHLGLRDATGAWDASLFVRNVFDRVAIDNLTPETRTHNKLETGYQRAEITAPRLVGVSGTYRF